MKNSEILSHVDHTLLKACAAWSEIGDLCAQAIEYKTASVCIPPSYVKRVREAFPSLCVCTVIGFPLGYSVTAVKEAEVRAALEDGADEVDMVVNLGWVKDGEFQKITDEITVLKRAAGDKILKVIIETCYLDEAEKTALCKAVTDAGADYIKTSTGFGTSGASLADVELFKRHIGSNVKIKASGGIRAKADMEAYLEAGCDRLGTSSAVNVLAERD
ncbi:MAG: deoxyribose-phosphate aldolase [Clostridiales bacterium]|jgi:deoxyribose-phosphate aldolase|nr:deoxyribose-phosphate aldolase [Clostridiales bacterium]